MVLFSPRAPTFFRGRPQRPDRSRFAKGFGSSGRTHEDSVVLFGDGASVDQGAVQDLHSGDSVKTLPLPSSVKNGPGNVLKTDTIAAPYHWRPVQVKSHEQKSDMSYLLGTYVNTLTMNIGQFEGAQAHMIRLEPNNFKAKEALWCYLVGDSFVICRGTVVGTCPREHDLASGRNMRIARLPVHMRPRNPLQFAALSREAHDAAGHVSYSSHLVTLVVTTDGWISGVSGREMQGAIDLSAVRFCIGGGISLMDEVSLHTCDIAGSRMVTLQGRLTERFFAVHSHKALALLPESCRPPRELPFIVAGASPGGFHLLVVRPSRGGGMGGDLIWRDSIWNHDQINLTGMMFEVSDEAVHVNTLNVSWNAETLKVFVQDFQNHLIRKFGSIEAAWEEAFDLDGSGEINFTEFGMGCKSAGYVGNATRLWAALDEDRSGEISLDELNTGIDPRRHRRSLTRERFSSMEPQKAHLDDIKHMVDNIEHMRASVELQMAQGHRRATLDIPGPQQPQQPQPGQQRAATSAGDLPRVEPQSPTSPAREPSAGTKRRALYQSSDPCSMGHSPSSSVLPGMPQA